MRLRQNPAICAAHGDVHHYPRRSLIYSLFNIAQRKVLLGKLSVVLPVVLRVLSGACVFAYPTIDRPNDALRAHPLHTMRPDRLSTDVASSSWFRSYANDSHVSTAASSAPENAAGRLPDEPKFAGQKSIWRLRLACGLRRYFARAVAVFWVGLFFAWPQERDSSRRWAISEAPTPCCSFSITVFADVRLIEGGDDFATIGNPIEFKFGLACFASMYAFLAVATWGNAKNAPLLEFGGFALLSRYVSDLVDFPRYRPSHRASWISRS